MSINTLSSPTFGPLVLLLCKRILIGSRRARRSFSLISFHDPQQASVLIKSRRIYLEQRTMQSHDSKSQITTAGIIIIGDEILKGQTQDTNTYFLAQELHKIGIKLLRVSVIPDKVDIISEEVRKFSKDYSVVITTGGIGPTHDDVTFEGVAKAFDDETSPHPKIVEFVKEWFKTDNPNDAALKLAQIPKKATLNFGVDKVTGKVFRFPVISVENVYVFPGIPDLLRRSFKNLSEKIFASLSTQTFAVRECFVNKSETEIASRLNSLVSEYPDVTFGSYPAWGHNYYKTKITIESSSAERSEFVDQKLKEVIPTMNYDKEPNKDAFVKIERLKDNSDDEEFKSGLTEAIETIKKCFEKYSPEEIIVCFNGGKDCIVMLHLVHAFMQKLHPDKKLQAIYIKDKDPFPEVEQFILDTEMAYNLEALNYEGPMKAALRKMLDEMPKVKAAVLGTRIGDPGAHYQNLFCPTDGNWPRVMRVNPILNWQYGHVWKFIRGLSLPYPSLYDQGYTSLGRISDTRRNPALKYLKDGTECYKPAHELEDGSLEREGRQ